MKKRKTVQEPVEIDVLQKKKDELAQFVERYNSAVAVVTGTVSNLESLVERKIDVSCMFQTYTSWCVVKTISNSDIQL